MSWSFSAVGRPEKIAEALDQHASKLTGPSLAEFESAKPYLKGLLAQNFVSHAGKERGYHEPLIEFNASGSASSVNGEALSGDCSVSIKRVHGVLYL